MKKKIYTLVYQAGIANVFEHFPVTDTRNTPHTGLTIASDRIRILQGDFRTCENFCRGLRHAKKTVRVAWRNEAGDITNSFWIFSKFENAPFNDKFAKDFVKSN